MTRRLEIALFLCLVVGYAVAFEMSSRWVQADETPLATTPLAPGPHPLGSLKPWLECISKSPGTITAYFGFNNPTEDNIGLPVGANNKFVPDPPNRSQTTNFLPGRSRYFPVYAFSVTIGSNAKASWQLNGYQVTADGDSAECEMSFVMFQMVVDAPPPLTGPSPAQVSALVTEAATQMGTSEDQIKTQVNGAGLGKYQIIFNVTEVENGISPVIGVTTLFGDNNKFSAFVDKAIAIGLAPSLVEPLPSGKEVEGVPITGGNPAAPSSTNPSSPNAPPSNSPSTPNVGPSNSPTLFPSPPTAIPPTAVASPSSAGSSSPRPNEIAVCLLVSFLFLVLFMSYTCL